MQAATLLTEKDLARRVQFDDQGYDYHDWGEDNQGRHGYDHIKPSFGH